MTRPVLLLALLAVGCHRGNEAAAREPTAVRVRAVERATAAAAARYSATIAPAARLDLAFKVGGYIDGVAKVKGVDGKPRAVQAGDKVARGVELAAVRKADYGQKLAEARAALAEASAAREQAQMNYDRAANLVKTGSISKAEGDNARVALDAAVARAAGARVRVDEAQTALADTSLRAPMDGVLLARTVEIGSLAAPGTVAFSIADTTTVKAVFGVPDTVLQTLQLGATQALTTDSMKGEMVGRITRISPLADPKSHVFEVEVTLDNASDELKSGMVCSLNLGAVAATAPVAVLPLSAIVRAPAHPDGYAVYIVDARGAARIREVELGDLLGNQIPVKSGLSDGEKVVVMGASLLSDGDQVQVIP